MLFRKQRFFAEVIFYSIPQKIGQWFCVAGISYLIQKKMDAYAHGYSPPYPIEMKKNNAHPENSEQFVRMKNKVELPLLLFVTEIINMFDMKKNFFSVNPKIKMMVDIDEYPA